ncbi:uncharacterized protein B0T15DRAFT_438649 [Chaetomium strumarium]|uniref:Uncharacterized protein n=1 Tax=Chaetomium strumarium TaxID=1170767 RepID=A0AAJ0GNY0_9PEZI|nr:hypothetical protein B0T15DRAFT_438649 [Chaetomium strumarium]
MTTAVVRPLPHARGIPQQPNGLVSVRPVAVALARILSVTLSTAYAAPLAARSHNSGDEPEAEGASLWVLYVASGVLVLLGGAFAGLTIALMGQDGIYLQVMARDPSEPQQRNAKRVHDLLNKGKHWVLVTLLLANVIVNETLPVVLDRCLGGGVAAVVGSTFLIVIFGEVLPQSVCVRYGLQIGGYMSKPVLAMMYLLAPIAWPTAKLLDWLLGEDHGTVYKKSGLKTLVTLHKSLGEVSQRLTQDEVTIISAVLDLKDKSVADVMTPMDDVFVMSEDTVLDEETMAMILSAGYSRIPIHETGNPTNFVGMLLVKILITYDPEDCKLVRDFPLATLPETRPETSCLDIVNFFQEGKSHMVLVSEYPGEDHGALGVVTLEDVIEELIGEEIIDESDVYIDVHKAIRRLTPAPKARVQRRQSDDPSRKVNDHGTIGRSESESILEDLHQAVQTPSATGYGSPMLSSSPKTATLMLRRSSAGLDGQMIKATVPVRANLEDIKQHLKHLGPSNPATNPNKTRSTTVKIKPGSGAHLTQPRSGASAERASEEAAMEEGDETTRLLRPELSGKDGIQALGQQNYGSVGPAMPLHLSPRANDVPILILESGEQADKSTQTSNDGNRKLNETATGGATSSQQPGQHLQQQSSTNSSGGSASSTPTENTLVPKRPYVRSGSITENIVESRGVRKVVLEMASSTDEEEPQQGKSNGQVSRQSAVEEQEENEDEDVFVSPFSSSSRGEEVGSYAEAVAKGASQGSQDDSSNTGSGAGKKKNNRRKKRKGGRA